MSQRIAVVGGLTRKAVDETAHQLALAQGLYRWRSEHEKCVVVLHERERNEEVVVASPEKAHEDESFDVWMGKSILKDSRKALEGVDITQVP